VAHVYNPSTWEAEAGGSQVQNQAGLHRETLSSLHTQKNFVLGKLISYF
jgi:hypothetical protein